jgi:hypothetical protein
MAERDDMRLVNALREKTVIRGRWLSGPPWSVIRPFAPELRAGAMNVVVPPRESTIVSSTAPEPTNAITSCGVSSQRSGPSTGSVSNTFCPLPTKR